MKIGLDFGLNLGGKVDKSAALNTQTGQTDSSSGLKTRCFTISKWVYRLSRVGWLWCLDTSSHQLMRRVCPATRCPQSTLSRDEASSFLHTWVSLFSCLHRCYVMSCGRCTHVTSIGRAAVVACSARCSLFEPI